MQKKFKLLIFFILLLTSLFTSRVSAGILTPTPTVTPTPPAAVTAASAALPLNQYPFYQYIDKQGKKWYVVNGKKYSFIAVTPTPTPVITPVPEE